MGRERTRLVVREAANSKKGVELAERIGEAFEVVLSGRWQGVEVGSCSRRTVELCANATHDQVLNVV
jgi:hypothetical protein